MNATDERTLTPRLDAWPAGRLCSLNIAFAWLAPLALIALAGLGCGRTEKACLVAGPPGHAFFRVRVGPTFQGSGDGRLLIFVKKLPEGKPIDEAVDAEAFKMSDTWVTAREVHNFNAGKTVEVNADETAYPKPFSVMPPGRYEVQALLDANHSYSYSGRNAEDWVSDVMELDDWNPQSGKEPELKIERHPETDWKRAATIFAARALGKLSGARVEEFTSPGLSRFWGRPVTIRAWMILPPGYSEKGPTFPTVYWTHGFSGGLESALLHGLDISDRMKNGKMPPMIWVMLDQSIPQGTHEFADSANNGPWGTALTTEFIPWLESKYRMDARPSARFLNGHSSGGWAALQLQVNYPKIFGGAWATSPDSSDFHDFSGVDLYAPNANLYRRADGSAVPLMREKGRVVATMEDVAQLEPVIGPYGGQMASFDWVFSPKGPDGAPLPMFDRETGRVDPAVVAYWREHYDLSHLVEAHWAERGPELKGRIHVAVGTSDTFYLDGAARRFEAVLTRLGGEPHFTFLEGRSHSNVYAVGGDPEGLFNEIGAEMYAVARPGSDWPRR